MAEAREIYRAWLRELKEEYLEFGQWRLDNINDFADLNYHFNQFLIDLAAQFDEEGNKNPLKYLSAAEREINKIKAKLVKKFPQIETDLAPEEIAETDAKLFKLDNTEETSKAGLKKRKRLFPDLASLADYASQ